MLPRPDLIEPQLVRAGLTGEPCAILDRDLLSGARVESDVPRVERIGALTRSEGEHARPLEKEITTLREEEGKTREVDLPLVRLDLGEVGVDACGRPQARRHAVVEVEAQVPGKGRSVVTGRAAGGIGTGHVPDARDRRRDGFEAHPLRHASQPPKASGEDRAHPFVPAPSPPQYVLVLPLDRALEVDAPLV